MPLVAGPFLLQSEDQAAISPGVYDFTQDALDLAARVQSNTSGWDDFFTAVDALDITDDLDTLDTAGLLLAIDYAGAWSDIPNLDTSIQNYSDADSLLSDAIAFAPSAAWEDPPAPYVPPGSVLNLSAPTVPIDAFNAVTTGTVGDESTLTNPGVQLWNFTRVGYANFFAGDTFEMVFLGNPGQTVSVGGSFNGAQLTYTDMGVLDSTGKLALQGTMSPDVIGAWHEDWYFDGALVKSFDFIVSPAGV